MLRLFSTIIELVKSNNYGYTTMTCNDTFLSLQLGILDHKAEKRFHRILYVNY